MLYVAETHTLFAIPLARVFDPGARFRRFPLGPGVIGGLAASTPDGIWLGTYPWRGQSRAKPSPEPNSLLAGKIQGILLAWASEGGH
jgi:hypothetical protein